MKSIIKSIFIAVGVMLAAPAMAGYIAPTTLTLAASSTQTGVLPLGFQDLNGRTYETNLDLNCMMDYGTDTRGVYMIEGFWHLDLDLYFSSTQAVSSSGYFGDVGHSDHNDAPFHHDDIQCAFDYQGHDGNALKVKSDCVSSFHSDGKHPLYGRLKRNRVEHDFTFRFDPSESIFMIEPGTTTGVRTGVIGATWHYPLPMHCEGFGIGVLKTTHPSEE